MNYFGFVSFTDLELQFKILNLVFSNLNLNSVSLSHLLLAASVTGNESFITLMTDVKAEPGEQLLC
jgi:hypothetical protein